MQGLHQGICTDKNMMRGLHQGICTDKNMMQGLHQGICTDKNAMQGLHQGICIDKKRDARVVSGKMLGHISEKTICFFTKLAQRAYPFSDVMSSIYAKCNTNGHFGRMGISVLQNK